jgi:hypothetical protein
MAAYDERPILFLHDLVQTKSSDGDQCWEILAKTMFGLRSQAAVGVATDVKTCRD